MNTNNDIQSQVARVQQYGHPNVYANSENIDGNAFIKLLKKYKSDKYIEEKINKETKLAISSLDALNSSKYKEGLIRLAEFCQQRIS